MLVEACAIAPGDRVLDVAAGSGNVALRAAAAGADVVASDELFGDRIASLELERRELVESARTSARRRDRRSTATRTSLR
ncbi:MAG TPA: hypothetical protein VG474_01890, partial [Solirubrobacteraceae bacterium]|nr:hypothetical protein [Solirubrobacteraceae bacterium]